MYRLNFFIKLYFMDYIKNVVIPKTNKRLNSEMSLSEYFRVIVCRLIMACYWQNTRIFYGTRVMYY